MRKCIDCGNDGNKELGLIIYTPMNIESWEQHIIVKDVDGTLQMIYSDVAWSRSSIYMNEYGYIFGDGSGGAAYHGLDKSFIDADGKWHFIYSDSSTAGIVPGGYGGDLWFNGESHMVPEDTQLDGEYCFLQFDFKNNPDDDSEYYYTYAKVADDDSEADWESGFRGYFYSNLVDDDSIYADTHPLKQFFEQEGLQIKSLKEIDQMIAEKEAAEGLSEDIKSGKNFYLYCPGTQKSQIDEKVMSILHDSFQEDKFEGDKLNAYILFGIDGNNYVWRMGFQKHD